MITQPGAFAFSNGVTAHTRHNISKREDMPLRGFTRTRSWHRNYREKSAVSRKLCLKALFISHIIKANKNIQIKYLYTKSNVIH